jgi:hypothetical protein
VARDRKDSMNDRDPMKMFDDAKKKIAEYRGPVNHMSNHRLPAPNGTIRDPKPRKRLFEEIDRLPAGSAPGGG